MAYYSPYEWNRRITHECNRAWGYVRKKDGGTEVRYIRGKGLLTPSWLLVLWAFCYYFFIVETPRLADEPVTIFLSLGIALFCCLISAAESFFTDAGIAGENEILRMLQNPKDYCC